jgi:hypothetical protein
MDLYAIDKSNRLLRLKLTEGDTWGVVPNAPNMVLYPGTDIRSSPPCCGTSAPAPDFAVGLYGTSGTSKVLEEIQICEFPDVPSNVTLARSAANPSVAFFDLGRTRPISVGKDDAWLLTNSSTMSGRILRSTRGSCFGAWSTYAVPELADQFDALPWSIADGRTFRNVRGELFAIGRAYHLINYIP